MPKQQFKQHPTSFSGGMNKDLDYSIMKPNMYLHAENLRLVADENNSTGALENVKGNKIIITDNNIREASSDITRNYLLIGYTVNGNKAILFLTAEKDAHSAIFEVVFEGNTVSSYKELYNDSGLSKQLDFTENTTISAVLRKENTNIENLYWLDGTTGIRYFNVIDAPDSLKDGGSFVTPNNFSPSPSFPFADTFILLDSIGSSGSLKTGMVQYAYRFVSNSGSESPISDVTGLYHITESGEFESSTRTYTGSDIDTDCDKSFTMEVTVDSTVTSLYNEIVPYSIHYDKLGGLPIINELTHVSMTPGTIKYKFTDSGSGYISTLTLTEFLVESSVTTNASSLISKARLLESKDNRLFLADVETTSDSDIDLSSYDSRAYRFTAVGDTLSQTAKIYDSNANEEAAIDGSLVTPNWPTDTDLDAINSFNDMPYYGTSVGAEGTGRDNPYDDYNHYKYQKDGTTLGASGPNIDISFAAIRSVTLDDSNDSKKAYVSDKSIGAYGFSSYASPNNTANYKSYQRDEIYRFSIKFIDDTTGKETSPQWICDLRMPHLLEKPAHNLTSSNILIGVILSPSFTVNSLPEGATSYQILRTERTSNDKSVLSQGIIKPTFPNNRSDEAREGDGSGWQAAPDKYSSIEFDGDYTNSIDFINTTLLQFVSPETSFYKEGGFPLKGDYIESIGIMNSTAASFSGADILTDGPITSKIYKWYGDTTADVSVDEIEDTKILRSIGEPYYNESGWNTGVTADNYSIGGEKFWTYMISPQYSKDRVARMISSMIYKSAYTEHITKQGGVGYEPFNYGGTLSYLAPYLANYKRFNYNTMYGGNTKAARENNEYIVISSIQDGTGSTTPYNGDTFISSLDLQPITYENFISETSRTDVSFVEVDMVPLESTINMELRQGDYATKFEDITNNIKYLNEDGNSEENIEPLYKYNTIYSKTNSTKTDSVITDEQRERITNTFNNRIVASNNKIDGAKDDGWLKYPANNYIDIDSSYGSITRLFKHEDRLYYFQERGVGFVSVNERSLIQDLSGQQLALGTGTLLSRFDYITTDYGCSDKKSIIDTAAGLYWFDSYTNSILRVYRDQYNKMQVSNLSKEKSVQPFMNQYDFTSCVTGKDEKHNEVLFTLSNGTDIKTLVYNERMDMFQSLYSVDATDYINVNRNLVSTNDSKNFYIHSRDDANYSTFYGTTNDSTIKILVNSDIGLTKVFDVANFISKSIDSNDKNIFYNTIDEIRVYNTYQNSDWVTLTVGDNIDKRGKDWSLRIPRNAVSVDLDDNPNIFEATNLDSSKQWKERMRDKYLIIDLKYDNTPNYRFNLPLFVTKYRLSYR